MCGYHLHMTSVEQVSVCVCARVCTCECVVCPAGGQLVPVRVLAAAGRFRHVEVVETQHAARAAGLVETRVQRVTRPVYLFLSASPPLASCTFKPQNGRPVQIKLVHATAGNI